MLVDIPGSSFWRQFKQIWPDALVILTIRDNTDIWYKSFKVRIVLYLKNCNYFFRFNLLKINNKNAKDRFRTFSKAYIDGVCTDGVDFFFGFPQLESGLTDISFFLPSSFNSAPSNLTLQATIWIIPV